MRALSLAITTESATAKGGYHRRYPKTESRPTGNWGQVLQSLKRAFTPGYRLGRNSNGAGFHRGGQPVTHIPPFDDDAFTWSNSVGSPRDAVHWAPRRIRGKQRGGRYAVTVTENVTCHSNGGRYSVTVTERVTSHRKKKGGGGKV